MTIVYPPKRTVYFDDFLLYYEKASILQRMNLASPTGRDVNVHPGFDDPLMQYITIYDCVQRRYAGFSNALQQVFLGSSNPKRWQIDATFDGWRDNTDIEAQMWLCLWHRVTGSGASFSYDHGFRNSKVSYLAKQETIDNMVRSGVTMLRNNETCFTSIGNQIPPFPKPRPNADHRGSDRYFDEYSKELVEYVYDLLFVTTNDRWTIPQVFTEIEQWQKALGMRMFRFVYTAWVMDLAEYWPHWVNPASHVHYGKNALESLSLMYEDFYPGRVDLFMEDIMRHTENPEPMSLEDILCDYVRYVERYVPKGYEHLEPWQVQNGSISGHQVRHPSYLKIMEKARYC